jgi:Arc/MetJ family transcription regulator
VSNQHPIYTLRMKRTNLVLDEHLLEEALRLSGERTYSRAVERALADFVRRIQAGRILELAGSGLWEGDLAAMRGDRPKRRRLRERIRGTR